MVRDLGQYDFAVIGAGFGGSIASMVLRQLGYSVLLIEKGRHPRFAIGESSTPFGNLLLERISEEFRLPELRPFCEWGSWQAMHPEIAAGLKRGFTFYHHEPNRRLDLSDPNRQLLVAASPNDRVADTHWYRPDFDHFMVRAAQARGVEYLDEFQLDRIAKAGAWTIEGRRHGESLLAQATFLIDASGGQSALASWLGLDSPGFDNFPKTRAVYAHFESMVRLDELEPAARHDRTPYPPDDAALHHVFPGGWVWVLRFNNNITSAGVAFTPESGLTGPAKEQVWEQLLQRIPLLAEQLRSARMVTPLFDAPQLSFRRSRAVGPGWAMLPSASGFIDPLLSTGFALTLFGILRLGRIFAKTPPDEADLEIMAEYERATFRELDTAAELVAALYASMAHPERFNWLTLGYFAAVSFTETAWRLGKPQLANSFLLSDRPEFASALRELCARARVGQLSRAQVVGAIAPFDVIGLTDFTRWPWYPARPQDWLDSAQKLETSTMEIEALLAKLGQAGGGD